MISLSNCFFTLATTRLGSLLFLDLPALLPGLVTARGVAGAAGLVLVATVLPYLFYTKGLEGVESGKASIIANVEPVVAALNGVVLFHEKLSVWVLLGIVCVLGTVVLLAKDEKKEIRNGKA